jgi:hypothetical protein
MSDCLQIAAGCLATLKIDPEKMEAGLSADMLAGLALFTLFSPELGLWVGTFHHVIVVHQNTVQWMTAGMFHVSNLTHPGVSATLHAGHGFGRVPGAQGGAVPGDAPHQRWGLDTTFLFTTFYFCSLNTVPLMTVWSM